MQRVGYDADTGVYTYQDADGSYWEGSPGARYGELRRGTAQSQARSILTHTNASVVVGDGEPPESNDDDHLLGTSKKDQPVIDPAWRMMAPFLLLICVFLLGVYVLLGGRLWWAPSDHGVTCADNQAVYQVRSGDTCWEISRRHDMSLQQLESMNEDLDCDLLKVGSSLCVKKS
jgi:LysM domain-containing protein